MTDISIRTGTTYTTENQTWIGPGGITALRDLRSITLDRATFAGATALATAFPNGFIPSGVTLARVTATGLYVRYDPTYDVDAATAGVQSDGRNVALGFLAVSVVLPVNSTANISAALYWHGEVIEANLPTGHGLTAAGRTDLAAKFAFI